MPRTRTPKKRYYYDQRVAKTWGRWRVITKTDDGVQIQGCHTEYEARKAAGYRDGKGSKEPQYVPEEYR